MRNLSRSASVAQLVALFSRFQREERPPVLYRLLTGRMKGQAFITLPGQSPSPQPRTGPEASLNRRLSASLQMWKRPRMLCGWSTDTEAWGSRWWWSLAARDSRKRSRSIINICDC